MTFDYCSRVVYRLSIGVYGPRGLGLRPRAVYYQPIGSRPMHRLVLGIMWLGLLGSAGAGGDVMLLPPVATRAVVVLVGSCRLPG
jgi:hypothetical protein